MKVFPLGFLKSLVLALIVLGVFQQRGSGAESVLFFGNSYTIGSHVPGVENQGGLPKLIQVIAASKGHQLATESMTVPGKNWEYHLARSETTTALGAKSWDWVVLQDYSTEPTHIGNPELFMKTGEIFYRRIGELTPKSTVVLYQTWARAPGLALYGAESTKTTFANPAEMTHELVTNYAQLARKLKETALGLRVVVAPVGEAFALSLQKYPDIGLYGADLHHANQNGLYLAALVLYSTLYQADPVGATNEFPGIKIDPTVAEKLQVVAAKVIRQESR